MTGLLRRWAVVPLVAAAFVGAACSDDGTTRPPALTAAPSSTTTVPDDGVLRLGVLLPRSGAGAPLGSPMLAAVDLAVEEINGAGGLAGVPVEVIAADEGETLATASKGAAALAEAGVDAVIGPASSRLALGVLRTFVDRGIVTCSPTASAIALTSFPDAGTFLRTVPSDALQAMAMAEVVEGAGVTTAAVLAPDDEFGRSYTAALTDALRRRGIAVTEQVAYPSDDDDHTDEAVRALRAAPGAIALVGNSVSGRQMLAAVDSLAPKGLPVVVNDAVRRSTGVDTTPISAANVDVSGISPRATPIASSPWFTPALAAFKGVDPAVVSVTFAANAYDCVSLIAIAALAAGATDSAAIAGRLRDVSAGGASCSNFVSCQPILAQGRNVDLNGASGPLELDADGDITVGLFDKFRFDETGRDITVGDMVVTGA